MDWRAGGWHTVSVHMSPAIEGQRGELPPPVDRLPDPVMPLQVLAVQATTFDLATPSTRYDRSPHRTTTTNSSGRGLGWPLTSSTVRCCQSDRQQSQ